MCFGGVLLSHTLASAVPSALEALASGFGMGPGVSPPLSPPKLSPTHQGAHPHHNGGRNILRVCQEPYSERDNLRGQALGLLVPVSSTRYRAYTPGLSTQSSPGGLTRSSRWETSS